MPKQALSLIPVLLIVGCTGGGETSDTSPVKPASAESRIQAIEKSNMTPEEKAAAIQYAKQGQSQGDLMKKSYETSATSRRR